MFTFSDHGRGEERRYETKTIPKPANSVNVIRPKPKDKVNAVRISMAIRIRKEPNVMTAPTVPRILSIRRRGNVRSKHHLSIH